LRTNIETAENVIAYAQIPSVGLSILKHGFSFRGGLLKEQKSGLFLLLISSLFNKTLNKMCEEKLKKEFFAFFLKTY
jgi:hypothetical protein